MKCNGFVMILDKIIVPYWRLSFVTMCKTLERNVWFSTRFAMRQYHIWNVFRMPPHCCYCCCCCECGAAPLLLVLVTWATAVCPGPDDECPSFANHVMQKSTTIPMYIFSCSCRTTSRCIIVRWRGMVIMYIHQTFIHLLLLLLLSCAWMTNGIWFNQIQTYQR